ncbi:restriction endonuclease subunit S [Winogradskyella alexanderae]|uniref:Restriction endonuclease subunit S n=1 Tax=Winogradskyella alexanderae TaxID=2877123 RepID=A0ABS7XTA1_9FLAO|nr:restriction endonuclease subunit S [Winogradskyella alexanderae]MCA0132609.1 restriction endonuclease subunit S [Winogradskyella alexanderae]
MITETPHTNPTVTSSAVEKSQTLIPQLRFAEFDSKWDILKLGEIGKFKNGLNKDKKDFGFGHPFVNLLDVFGKSILEEENLDLVNANEKDLKLYDLRKGDVLFIRSSVKREGVGETTLILKDLNDTVYSGFLIRFRERCSKLELHYKRYCFTSFGFRKELLSYATSSANTNINQDSLSQVKLIFPTLPEQQKIASFLSTVDTKLQQLTKKKELLAQYKKGVMQQLFNQQLRFKQEDGSDYPDWEEKKLGDVCFKESSSLTIKMAEGREGEYLLYGASGILSRIDFFDQEDEYISIVKDGSGVGKIFLCEAKSSCLGTMDIIKLLDNNDLYFVYCLLDNLRFEKYIVGGAIPHIYFKDYSKEKIEIPCTEEQQQIAIYLSALDTKIETVTQQITQTQQFKKGLLQQMFV